MNNEFVDVIIQGAARTGKTYVANAVVEALTNDGLDVVSNAEGEGTRDRIDGKLIRVIEEAVPPKAKFWLRLGWKLKKAIAILKG